jgi:hypothetical protein
MEASTSSNGLHMASLGHDPSECRRLIQLNFLPMLTTLNALSRAREGLRFSP